MISQKLFGRGEATIINQLRSKICKKNKKLKKEPNKFLPDVAFKQYDASS
jgi:hypothetical protein